LSELKWGGGAEEEEKPGSLLSREPFFFIFLIDFLVHCSVDLAQCLHFLSAQYF